jgi:16S rRNA processing protein RimM
MHRVTIGRIARVRGVKGEVMVAPMTDDSCRFRQLRKLRISEVEAAGEFLVESARELKGQVLMKLKGVDDPEVARKLVGGFVEIEKDQLVQLPEGRYFIFDIVGLEVITTRGTRIGRVKEVMSLPANDLYLVEGEGKLHHIPATKEVIKTIDLEKGEMIIEPMEGLLDL